MKPIIICIFLLFIFFSMLSAQQLSVDANTTLLLHFNNNANGAAGETPTANQNITYTTGVYQQGGVFSSGNQLSFAATNNINSTQGTFECWLKPFWGGNDVNSYTILQYGGGGGMLFQKDGANNLRAIFNRYSLNGNSEVGVALNVSDWVANQYYHIAYTWNSEKIELFVNGKLKDTEFFNYPIPVISDSSFRIGSDGGNNPLNGMLDEVRISNVVRSAEDIAATFAAGFSSVSAMDLTPTNLSIWVTWEEDVTVNITTNLGTFNNVSPSILNWSSNNSNIASVNATGLIRGEGAGSTTIIGNLDGFTDQVAVNVSAPLISPEYQTVDPYLASPDCAVEFMPVVIIRYMPTLDGINVDTEETGWTSTLSNLKNRIETFDKRVKFALTESTKFRGYNNPTAEAYLGYYVVEVINVYEPLPPGIFNNNVYSPDYKNILERFDAEHYVNNLGVKEFWVWGYHHGDISPVESNMSSPTTGDISNSYREEDLPIYDHTYVLYNYNFTRTQAEAIHNHGHQLEAMFSYATAQQNGNNLLFWENFVGRSGNNPPIGRCGDTHHPPNTTVDYNYENTTFVLSDIEDWRPDNAGTKKMVNSTTWGNLNYNWPGGTAGIPQLTETQWYMYWMQSMPGKGNQIPHGANWMTNWWKMVGDWDAAINNGNATYSNTPAANPACTSAPLAIHITHLKAQPQGDFIQLQWQIAGVLKDEVFEILRKQEGQRDFEPIGQVAGIVGQMTYQFEDKTAQSNLRYYYQLRQKEETGKTTLSNVVTAMLSADIFEVQLFPNPVTDELQLTLMQGEENKPVEIEVINPQGQMVRQFFLNTSGEGSWSIPMQDLGSSWYWIRVKTDKGSVVKKVVVIED